MASLNFWTTSPRYEVKVVCDVQGPPEVEAWVRLHPAHWRIAYPPRQINNIYFDTADYQGLNANLSGVSERSKLRLRWYGGDLYTVESANLELKCKQGWVGWKEINHVEQFFNLGEGTWSEFYRTLSGVLNSKARRWLQWAAYPVLINTYQRSYYVTPDQKVRLTVDTSLCAYDQRFSAKPNLKRAAPLPAYVIVELKADCEDYQRLSDVLDHFPARVGRFSKYVQGVLSAPDF